MNKNISDVNTSPVITNCAPGSTTPDPAISSVGTAPIDILRKAARNALYGSQINPIYGLNYDDIWIDEVATLKDNYLTLTAIHPFPKQIEDYQQKIEQLESLLEDTRNNYKIAFNLMQRVRKALEVPEGESVVEYAEAVAALVRSSKGSDQEIASKVEDPVAAYDRAMKGI